MKKKFSKILGVGLTLALLCSLLLTAAPVSAVTTPVVTLFEGDTISPKTEPAGVISKLNVYKVLFTTGVVVPATGQIVVVFEPGTDITAISTGEVQINSTIGIGGYDYKGSESPVVAVTGTYPAAQTLTITLDGTNALGAGAIVQLTIGDDDTLGCVTNPNTAGTYNLTVATQTAVPVVIEAAVTSADYTIKVPTIPGLPGVASVYNPVGTLMAQENDLGKALLAAGVDYTIYVGPGTYTQAIDITHKGLTLVSTDGAAATIINVTTIGIIISAAEVTVDGFTVGLDVSGTHGIQIMADDATVINNIITAKPPTAIGIFINAARATVTGNVIDEDCTVYLCAVSDSTLSGNTFGESLNLYPGGASITGLTVTDNIMIGSLAQAIDFEAGKTFTDILIEGNTISGCTKDVAIQIRNATGITKLRILNNEITDNTGDGIRIDAGAWSATNVIKFNTITGNDTSVGDYGIQSDLATGNDVDAALNWWGTTVASEVAAMVKATVTPNVVTTAPFLAGTADTVFSVTAAGAGTTLDASTTVGVKVEGAASDATIAVAKYIANPQAAIAGAIAFYDVYVDQATTADVTVKFYAGDALTDVYLWAAGTQTWAKVVDAKVSFSAYGGYVYATVDSANLTGTPVALVGGAAEPMTAPGIVAPLSGADDVSLTPIFVWGAVPEAEGYCFELADNVNFVSPMVRLDGELGRLFVTAYAYVGELEYSAAYYWRVKAVSGAFNPWIQWTQVEHFDVESTWSTGAFITMDEPEEAIPPVVIEETEPPVIVIEPIVEVVTPAATEITPSWIYVIIGVGGVLVIALLVLIVRTRRVA